MSGNSKRAGQEFASYLKLLPKSVHDENNRRALVHAEKEAEAFSSDFSAGKCPVCRGDLSAYENVNPCLHWLVAPVIERSGLLLTDLEILRLHYAETLRHWRERFLASRRRQARLDDDRFSRMWEFYLACSESAFRYGGLMVFQAQLARRLDAVPLTRDYLLEREREGLRVGSGRQLTIVKRET